MWGKEKESRGRLGWTRCLLDALPGRQAGHLGAQAPPPSPTPPLHTAFASTCDLPLPSAAAFEKYGGTDENPLNHSLSVSLCFKAASGHLQRPLDLVLTILYGGIAKLSWSPEAFTLSASYILGFTLGRVLFLILFFSSKMVHLNPRN